MQKVTANNAHRAPSRCLVVASCAAISLLVFFVSVPASSVGQIGGQTGYQEWVPPAGGTADRGGGAAGGGGGGAAGGDAAGAPGGAGGGATTGATGGGLLAAGDTATGGTGGVSAGGGAGTGPTQPVGVGPNGEQRAEAANQGGQPATAQVPAPQSDEAATGTIPLTRDNILLALAVAALAIGAGFGVNRLARRTAGT